MDTGFRDAEILLPHSRADYHRWSVVACDQFTSEPNYWEELRRYVGDAPSTLNMIFPEVYLSQDNTQRIAGINTYMKKYLSEGVLSPAVNGCVLTVRSTPYTERRIGIVGCVDLEAYDYAKDSKSLIRATEGTILERIPPRVRIRENALLELPHIMLLIDDSMRSVVEPVYETRHTLGKLYDFDLNMDGGHITGYAVPDTKSIQSALAQLLQTDTLRAKYGRDEKLLFAVGDGNHSLATAKACWEKCKQSLSKAEQEHHPRRFALVEIVNIYDEGIRFEPIHRVVFGAGENFIRRLESALQGGQSSGCCVIDGKKHEIPLPAGAVEGVSLVQNVIDLALSAGEISSVDYVHGTRSVTEITQKTKGSIGIILNAMHKNELFKGVIEGGCLPRKTFSMGEAVEKRYYLECKKLTR